MRTRYGVLRPEEVEAGLFGPKKLRLVVCDHVILQATVKLVPSVHMELPVLLGFLINKTCLNYPLVVLHVLELAQIEVLLGRSRPPIAIIQLFLAARRHSAI